MKKRWYQRALRTFVQAFVSALAITLSTTDLTDLNRLKSILLSATLSAGAAGISAVMNWLDEKNE